MILRKNSFSNWHRPAIFVALTALGFAGNYFSIELFFGVDFIFGSIATLLALMFFGTVPGIAASLIAASYTYFFWFHPYAAIALTLETVFVALTLKRLKDSLALSSGCYWIFIGIPLVFLTYHYGLGLDTDAAVLIAVKQGSNGILNSIAAALILTYAPIRNSIDGPRKSSITVFEHTFNVFVALALFPSMVLVTIDAHRVVGQIEKDIGRSIETLGAGLNLSIQRWREQHMRAIAHLAVMAEDFGYKDRKLLQKFVQESHSVWSEFLGMFFTDQMGTTIAFTPLKNYKGESTIGINFSDRPYFQILRDSNSQIYISEVFMARGGVFEPVVNISARVDLEGKFAGIVAGSLNLRELQAVLSDVSTEDKFKATLVESDGTIIVSNDLSLKALETYKEGKTEPIKGAGENIVRRWPERADLLPVEVWRNSSLVKTIRIAGDGNWRLIVEMPTGPWQTKMYGRYIQILSFLIVLSAVIVAGSLWFATRISRPLLRLSEATTDLPSRLESNDRVQLPEESFAEVGSLTKNFKVMLEALKKRFQDLEQSRHELDRANKSKDDFLATLSHELRTPLASILGHAEILKTEVKSSELQESVDTIYRNALAQNQIIADLLDISAIITGKISFHPKNVALTEIVTLVLDGVRPQIERKDITLKVDRNEKETQLFADGTRLQQVLWNLLSNAIKFTPQGGEIDVISRVDKSGWTLCVRDTGKGIANDFLPFIFDRFRQEDSSTTRSHGGLGIGLSIAQQIVKYHDGKISVASGGRGKGSSFTVMIPASRFVTEDARGAPIADRPKVEETLSGLRVLLIDDDADARALTHRYLTRSGALVETADSAAQGLQRFSSFNPDVVVSDIGMPGEDGFSFIRRLRAMDDGKHVPAAALTAFAMDSDREAIIEAGFQAHVIKPVSKAHLIETIARLSKS